MNLGIIRVFAAILLLILTSCVKPGQVAKLASPTPSLEMDVMVSLLKDTFGTSIAGGATFVVDDQFSSDLTDHSPRLGATYFGWSRSDLKRSLLADATGRIPSDLLDDFCDKIAIPSPVWPKLSKRLKIIRISRAEVNSLFRGKSDGWKQFYAKYPQSPGIITLSRVGFNQKHDRAMLYMGDQYVWLGGHGQIYVFHKAAGKWLLDSISIGPSWES